ncbi:hypothetical protein GE061_017432 [Apolygus lucorum]|uniref:Uncharacterized protein n=1 Tax=Apolygus lucorum TaxID=248454 RepID=A0A8S9XB60_APOLU|nr:hypothetical protein GE061_017432 [Apolygus lucorum]
MMCQDPCIREMATKLCGYHTSLPRSIGTIREKYFIFVEFNTLCGGFWTIILHCWVTSRCSSELNGLVTFAVLIAWYFSFLIIFVLPLDVSNTVYRTCLVKSTSDVTNTTDCKVPWSRVSDTVYPNLWRIVYWSSQFLTWLILPLMQSYAKAGEFTVRGKLKSALVDNAIYYGSYLFICGVLLIYIAVKPGLHLGWAKNKSNRFLGQNTRRCCRVYSIYGILRETSRPAVY